MLNRLSASGKPKVANFEVAIGVEKQVGGFQVPVND
jgi:hypothetical protein